MGGKCKNVINIILILNSTHYISYYGFFLFKCYVILGINNNDYNN